MKISKLTLCIFLLIIFVFTASLTFATEYSETYNFQGSIRMKTSQLIEMSNKIYAYVDEVNGGEKSITRANFKSNKYSATLELPLSVVSQKEIPDKVTSFLFSITSLSGDVNHLIIDLDDYNRYCRVTGNNHEKIIALLGLVKTKIEPYETGFGGNNQRSILGVLFLIVFYLCFMTVFWAKTDIDKPKTFAAIIALAVILPNSLIHFPQWESILPGLLVTHNNLSFLQANSHVFTFLGVFGPLLPLVPYSLNKLKIKSHD